MQTPNLAKSIPNDQWITDDSIADPSPLPRPLGWRIVVRPVSIKKITKGGIHLPDNVVSDMQSLTTVGRVLAIGPLTFSSPEMGGFPWYKVGDHITYAKYAGTKFLYKGVRLLILNDDEPILSVDDPRLLDPLFALTN